MWNRIPLALRALLLAISVTGTATLIWGVLAQTNLRLSPELPWAAVVMAVFLIFYWRFLRGWGWPRSTANARRAGLRAEALSSTVWRWSLVAGGLALGSSIALFILSHRLIRWPQPARLDLSHIPSSTLWPTLLMSATVAYQRRSRLPRIFAGTDGAPIRSRRSHRRHQHCFRARPFEPWRISAGDSLRYWLGCTLRIANLSEWFHFAGGGAAQQCRRGRILRCMEIPGDREDAAALGVRSG